jgi:hypothetical protein
VLGRSRRREMRSWLREVDRWILSNRLGLQPDDLIGADSLRPLQLFNFLELKSCEQDRANFDSSIASWTGELFHGESPLLSGA